MINEITKSSIISSKNEKKKEKKKEHKELVKHQLPQKSEKHVKMRRLEIICSQAVIVDVLQGFKNKKIKCYTQLPSVMGSGYSVPKLGDSIWPQLNSMFIVYCSKEDSKKIRTIIDDLRKQYVGEGIACYVSKAKEW